MNNEFYVNPKLYVKNKNDIVGKGVYAHEKISKGELISRSIGQVSSNEEWEILPENHQKYCYEISDKEVFCPLDFENPTIDWYVNHSCNPNCGCSASDNTSIFAMRDIETGEEITIDYSMLSLSADWGFRCFCGAKNCRGNFRGDDYKIPVLQGRYKSYFQKSVQEKINLNKN